MTDRRRKAGSVDSSQELQLWATVRSKLVALRDCQRRAEQSATAINSLQTQWQGLIDRRRKLNGRPSEGGEEEDDDEDDNDIASDEDEAEERIHMQNKIESQYEKLRLESDEEKSIATEALESLSILLALRTPEQLQLPEGNKRKKRKVDGVSPGPEGSLPGSRLSSPAPQAAPIVPSRERGARSSLTLNLGGLNGLASTSSPVHTPGIDTPGSTPLARSASGKIMSKRERKEILMAQLPLKAGRPVAFKPPGKPSGGKGSKMDGTGTDWIEARVVRTIGQDKNKYEVQDVQDADGIEGKPGACYNATLKAILVLPDPRDKSTYPLTPYPMGSDVWARYPDTTAFYRARVAGLPIPGKQRQCYKVIFEEDDEQLKAVPVDYVVDIPQ